MKLFISITLLVLFSQIPNTYGQSAPADLLDLSLHELMDVEIRADGTGTKWSIGYIYTSAKFEGFKKGTKKLTDDEVSSSGQTRTTENFPILPREIKQQAHILNVSYAFTNSFTFLVEIPYIKQSTDHVSIATDFDTFTIETKGVGDISLLASKKLELGSKNLIIAGFGFTLPIGSINETGDTPSGGLGDSNPLPFTMQLGSGTYDLIPSVSYTAKKEKIDWGVGAFGKIRLGRNNRDYRLGNKYQLTCWIQGKWFSWAHPSIKVNAYYWQEITGDDTGTYANASTPETKFGANVANPANYGGKKIAINLGSKFNLPGESFKNTKLEFDIGLPVYQNLNGIQTEEDFNFSFALNQRF